MTAIALTKGGSALLQSAEANPLKTFFDLARFRVLAFRRPLPDHPMRTLEEARKLIALVPEDDPAYGLADLTNWTATMNLTEAFTAGRRARILMLLDDAARPLWRSLGSSYLAPHGRPIEGRDGDAKILRAMFDSASEFASGFEIALDTDGEGSRWVKENLPRLIVRNMRWLARRLALAHMLHLPAVDAIWTRLHQLYVAAEDLELSRVALPAYEGGRYRTSVKREYLRPLLFELAAPDSVSPRMVELIYRISARVATSVRLEREVTASAAFAVVPHGAVRPVPVRRVGAGAVRPPLYLDTTNCLPRLRAAAERDLGRDPGEDDNLFGRGYTRRERNAALDRLMEYWGSHPPQRRSARVAMATAVRVAYGFENVAAVVPALEKKQILGPGAQRRELKLMLDQTSRSLKRAQLTAARERLGRLVDASTGGLGIAIRRTDATWATHGMLVAVLIEPARQWTVGVLRRIVSFEDELRFGIQTLTTRPRSLWMETEVLQGVSPWEEAELFEPNFRERFCRGLLLDPQEGPLSAADLLLPPGLATRGTQFDVTLASGPLRIRVSRVLHDSEYFQRVLFEPLAAARR